MEADQQKQSVFFLWGGVGLGEWLNINGTKSLCYKINIMLKSKESKTKFDIDTHFFSEGR